MVRSDERQYDLHELSVQMARVKEKTRPWKEAIALILAIGAAVVSHNAAWIFADLAGQTFSQLPTVIAYALAVVFCVLATTAVLGISSKTRTFTEPRLGSSHAAIIRYTILLAFAIINTILLLMSTQVTMAVFLVFLTLEATEVVLFIGGFLNQAPGHGATQVGGYIGILTALVAWYTAAAGIANGLPGPLKLPVGKPMLT